MSSAPTLRDELQCIRNLTKPPGFLTGDGQTGSYGPRFSISCLPTTRNLVIACLWVLVEGLGFSHRKLTLTAVFDIQKAKDSSVLRFTQIGVPPHRYSGHYRGWIEAYWTPMKEVLASGKISEKTRARVEADRKQRIRTLRFRRKISSAA